MARLKATFIVIAFSLTGFASAQEIPDNPQPVIDRNFLLVSGAHAAAMVGDLVTTSLYVGHNYHACSLEIGNPALYGRQPRPVRTSLVMGGLYAATVFSSYELKKHRARIWKVPLWPAPQAYIAYGNAYGTLHNLQKCR